MFTTHKTGNQPEITTHLEHATRSLARRFSVYARAIRDGRDTVTLDGERVDLWDAIDYDALEVTRDRFLSVVGGPYVAVEWGAYDAQIRACWGSDSLEWTTPTFERNALVVRNFISGGEW